MVEQMKMEMYPCCTSFQLANYLSKTHPVAFNPARTAIEDYVKEEGCIFEYKKLARQIDEREIVAFADVFCHILLLMEEDKIPKKFVVIV